MTHWCRGRRGSGSAGSLWRSGCRWCQWRHPCRGTGLWSGCTSCPQHPQGGSHRLGWGAGESRCGGRENKKLIEYQYLKSGTVTTPDFVCHNLKSGGPMTSPRCAVTSRAFSQCHANANGNKQCPGHPVFVGPLKDLMVLCKFLKHKSFFFFLI